MIFFNEYFVSINNFELSFKYELYLEKIFKLKSLSWVKKFKFFVFVMKLLFDKKIKNKFSFFKLMKFKILFKKEFEVVVNKIGIGDYIYKNVNEFLGG